MDIAWKSICETISLSGPHGISMDQFKNELKSVMKLGNDFEFTMENDSIFTYLLEIYAGLTPDFSIGILKSADKFKKDPKTKLMSFVDLEPIKLSSSSTSSLSLLSENVRFYCSNLIVRRSHLFQGRPIQLSDSSLQTLELIASYGRNGVTQAELAKVLGCDSKNAFHWLKSLIENDLITRTPVASKKSFTYLLTFTRFLDDEEVSKVALNRDSNETHTVISSKEIRQSIVDILARAPNQTMVSKDVFAATGLDPLLIKNFRRAATKLNEIGWLEYLFEDQLIGPYCRLFRLKRKPAEGLDLKTFLATQDEVKKQLDFNIKTSRGSDFNPGLPIIHQIILLLAQSFPEPLTTGDLSHRLNVPRKYLYKLIEHISPVSTKKSGVIGAEGVGKVSDFVGKEKRLKLFIKTEEYRDLYMKMFSSDTRDAETVPVSRPTTPMLTRLSETSTPQSSPSDTISRRLRHQALLQELSEHGILELNKELCHRIQSRLGDSRYQMDSKTLRRSAEILEKEGSLKFIIVSVSSGTTKTLLTRPDLSASDPLVVDFMAKLNEFVRTGPLSASTLRFQKLKEAMQQDDFFVDGSLPIGVPQNPSVNLRALLQFGFIYGILARAQLFHQFLLQNAGSDGNFETIPTVFEQMPLGLYLKLIGIVRMSRNLFEKLREMEMLPISDLPEMFKEEIGLNRKRFQSQASILLQILEQLKLIQGEEQFASLNFKLPFKYKFAIEVPFYDYNYKIKKIIQLTHNGVNEFWEGLQQISSDYQQRNVSIHTENDLEIADNLEIPKAYLLARHFDSWKVKPSRERDLEKEIRKLISRSEIVVDSDRLELLSKEFDVPVDRVTIIFNNLRRMFEEREEVKRLDKLAKRRRFDADEVEDEDEDSDEADLEHLRWTPADWSKLSIAFCILQQPFFLSPSSSTTTNTTGIKWNLATKIFDKPKSPIVIRRHGLKLFKSYEELRKLMEIDTVVQLVMRKIDLNSDNEDISTLFKTIFETVQSEIESESIFESFSSANFHNGLIMKSRQDHFISTIDNWVQTRSFRHGLLQNNPGHIKREITKAEENVVFSAPKVENNVEFSAFKAEDNTVLFLLRQILVYSFTEDFDYDLTVSILKSLDQESLNKSVDRLVSTNFASKNRHRDKSRLFAFPLVISESVRSVIEFCGNEAVNDLLVDNTTETLTINRIERIVDSVLDSKCKIEFKSVDQTATKFDAPIHIKQDQIDSEHDWDLTDLVDDSNHFPIWIIPKSSNIILPNVAIGCLSHVRKTVKSSPGITFETLKKRYEGILEGFEIEILVKKLIKSREIELISDQFLQ